MKILIIDDEENLVNVMKINFEKKGYEVRTAYTGRSGIEEFAKFAPTCVLTDLKMPDINGLEVLKEIKTADYDVPVILITAYGSVESAINAVKMGAYDFIAKPFDFEVLHKLVKEAIEMYQVIRNEKSYLTSEIERAFPGVVGKNKKMKEIFDIIADISYSNANVFITGESGTGKDLIARTIHFLSSRKSGAFIVINCAALPEDLLEAELFGYEKGAFTSALSDKPGLFEVANGGTIFLDEISEMSSKLQAKLLNAIQNREIRRVGGIKSIKIDVRFIASSNKNIEKEVQEKRFREDLYYRLNVIRIHLPALRERKEDISLLSSYFIRKFSRKNSKNIKGLSNEALFKLMNYDFNGNVRELENIIEKAVILEKSEYITAKHIEIESIGISPGEEEGEEDIIKIQCLLPIERGFEHILRIYEKGEKELILKTIAKYPRFSNQEIADFLATNRRILELRMKKYGINKKDIAGTEEV